ncbi:MAG: chemotaxis protein CheB [Betaproteobacteria bacterium HGW-Betaproteobacteria-10]|nr:MAG: chemotaxis protein CheB [Betaproteobacteria bacterium HGW-Betaproteobacteria-10]
MAAIGTPEDLPASALSPSKKTPPGLKKKAHFEYAPPAGHDFPVVGIGCSAGGLEALEAFLEHLPADCGMAVVIIQHLDPNHISTLPQILQRSTRLPVVEAADRVRLKANCIYVIPPNRDISIRHGVLYLLVPTSERIGLRLPVDFFLRSLADDQQENAVGVILSGMGSDGALGMVEIKEKLGLTVAQEPSTAKADSMPMSAIKSCVVDIIAPPEELPARIISYLKLGPPLMPPEAGDDLANHSSLDKITAMLRVRSGNDFSLYKPSTLYRRIERRTALLQIDGIAGYVGYLRENPQELNILFRELLIGVTNFFRDPPLWDFLAQSVLPALFAQQSTGKVMRAWVPACSSGEEAYSLAIVFQETLERLNPEAHLTLQIYATDLDPDAIDKARNGFYPTNIAADISPERLQRYFYEEDGGYRINKSIREMVVFATQNLISDPPFTKLDLLSCRNLLIYFGPELQKRLIPLFHYALNQQGILVLGSAETVGNFTHLFSPLDKKIRVFQRLDQISQPLRLDLQVRPPYDAAMLDDSAPVDFRQSQEYLTDQYIQQNFAPAAVLVNADGDIIYISGRTGKYLEPAAGKVNMNIHAMAREGLRDALAGVIRNAVHQAQAIHLDGLLVGTNGGSQRVNVTVQGLQQPEALRHRVLIVFNDVAMPPGARHKAKHAVGADRENALTRELQQTREALRSTHEEMQTSIEEAKSANEELQASNEELTTSKEELQSINEELQTVNGELQSKVDDLTWARNDMTNLLNSTEIATVFLDNQMKLRRYTTYATHLFKFIPADIGRSLSDIVTDLDYPQLQADALAVLSNLAFREQQVKTRDGRWYRVRIMPYRTQDNVIDGVVITFIDITANKQLEAELRKFEKGQHEPSTE